MAPSGRSAKLSLHWQVTRSSRSPPRRQGHSVPFIRAALAYWSDYPEEVEDFLDRARAEDTHAQAAWERQQGLLGL